jgi:hypothetical protein
MRKQLLAQFVGRLLSDDGMRVMFFRDPTAAAELLGVTLSKQECERAQRCMEYVSTCGFFEDGWVLRRLLQFNNRSVQY